MLHSLIKRVNFRYYNNKVNAEGGDSRKFWSVVNEIAGRPPHKEHFPVEAFCTIDDLVRE